MDVSYGCTVSLRSCAKFWHVPYERHARVTHVLAGRGCDGRRSAMRKSRLCALVCACERQARFISFSRLSFFTSASKETFGPGTDGVFIERPPRRAERFVMTLRNHRLTGLAPISRITHSRTPTTLLFSRRDSTGTERGHEKRRWDREANVCAKHIWQKQLASLYTSAFPVIHFDNWPIRSAASLRLLIQFPSRVTRASISRSKLREENSLSLIREMRPSFRTRVQKFLQ